MSLPSAISARARVPWLTLFASLVVIGVLAPVASVASNPPAGTITTLSSPLTWTGTALAGGSLDESTCVEGVNCDTYTLTVAGTTLDWAGKAVMIDVAWQNSLNDYDLYVHKDSLTGPLVGTSGGGAPQNSEAVAISPADTGVGIYKIHVVYFAVTPQIDQYRATARVGNNSAMYIKGGIGFGPNVTVSCPVAAADGEPSSRCDALGNYYIAGIRGVPAGVDLWYFDLNPDSPNFDPFMRNAQYRGQPDSFTQDESTSVGADGGGDVDLAVGFGNGPGGVPTVAFVSLVAANVSSAISTDLGKTWTLNPAGSATGGIPVDDRQWIEFYGPNVVYLLYRTFQPAVTQIQRSDDGGLTFGPARTVNQIGQVGSIDIDPRDGTVYVAGSRGMVGVGIPATPGAEPLTYTGYAVADDPVGGVANIFFVVRCADDGTLYACYSNGTNVYIKHSKDKAKTWSAPLRINDGPETRTALLPWLETGPTPGSIAVVWYGTSAAGNTADADWHVFMAQSFNATAPVPTIRQVQVTDHPVHAGVISTGGTLGDQNRNLLDYFQVVFDPQGAAVVGYTDDHNDFDGFTNVCRQVSGPSIKNGKKLHKQREGSALPPPAPFSSDGSQVVDFSNDVAIGLVGVVPHNDPLDILSIKYSSENDANGAPVIVATMKVATLENIVPQLNWRMNFVANAPYSGVNASGGYSNALSDRGDQFWVRASTDAAGQFVYTWGTAVRNTDGSLSYTQRGTADAGSVDVGACTITVKVSAAQLNAFVTQGSLIGHGTVLAGLRGSAFTSGANALRDATRGGLEFVIP